MLSEENEVFGTAGWERGDGSLLTLDFGTPPSSLSPSASLSLSLSPHNRLTLNKVNSFEGMILVGDVTLLTLSSLAFD